MSKESYISPIAACLTAAALLGGAATAATAKPPVPTANLASIGSVNDARKVLCAGNDQVPSVTIYRQRLVGPRAGNGIFMRYNTCDDRHSVTLRLTHIIPGVQSRLGKRGTNFVFTTPKNTHFGGNIYAVSEQRDAVSVASISGAALNNASFPQIAWFGDTTFGQNDTLPGDVAIGVEDGTKNVFGGYGKWLKDTQDMNVVRAIGKQFGAQVLVKPN